MKLLEDMHGNLVHSLNVEARQRSEENSNLLRVIEETTNAVESNVMSMNNR